MAADGKKGITVKVDAALHAEITQYLQDHGMTMTEFVTLALQDELHPTVEKEGFLTKQGVSKMRSSLAKDIFEQDLLCIYEKQTVQRDELRLHSKELIAEIISRINAGTYDNPKVEELLLRLADRLSRTKGKKVYGYLKADVKTLVDAIVDELAADEKIAALYNLWYEQKEEALQVYTETLPQRVPLSRNKEFKPIKNAVIQEALGLHADRQDVEKLAQADAPDPEMPEAPESDSQADDPIEPDPPPGFRSYSGGWGWKKDTWWTNEYTTIRYLNIMDDELIEASQEFYAKHSALYGVKELL